MKMRFHNTGIFGQWSSDAQCKLAEMLAKPVRIVANAKALAIQDIKSDASEPDATLAIKDLQADPAQSTFDTADAMEPVVNPSLLGQSGRRATRANLSRNTNALAHASQRTPRGWGCHRGQQDGSSSLTPRVVASLQQVNTSKTSSMRTKYACWKRFWHSRG